MIDQVDGSTILRFTKIMVKEGKNQIGDNTFLSWYGISNALSVQRARELFSLNLESGSSALLDGICITKASCGTHLAGVLLLHGGGLLAPSAIGATICRKLFSGGLWFKIHQTLNSLVILFMVISFLLAVAAINKETPLVLMQNTSVLIHIRIELLVW
jgi:hypothetical protein